MTSVEDARAVLEREVAARARLPDLSRLPAFTKTRWVDATRPLGFKNEDRSLRGGGVDRLRRWSGRVLLVIQRPKSPCRLVEISIAPPRPSAESTDPRVVDGWRTDQKDARAWLSADTIMVQGLWHRVPDDARATIDDAVTALVDAVPPHEPVPPVQWALAGTIPGGRPGDPRARCMFCRRMIGERRFVVLDWRHAQEPQGGTSAWRRWFDHTIPGSLGHVECAGEALLDAVVAAVARCAWADQDPALARFRGADAALTQGGLLRCATCRTPIRRAQWRLTQSAGPSPLHIECARVQAAQALEWALARAPAGFDE